MNAPFVSEIYRGITIVPYDVPGGWVMWSDDASGACDVAASIVQARAQIDEFREYHPCEVAE